MTKFNFEPRRRGQHRDKDLLPIFMFERRGRACVHEQRGSIGTVRVCGTFWGCDEFGDKLRYQRIEVTLRDGTRVPAYRRGPSYAICQDFEHKAAKS